MSSITSPNVAGLIPTLDLHVHLRGTLAPSHVLRLAELRKVEAPEIFDVNGHYRWRDFDEFLDVYHIAGSLLHTPEDLAEVALRHLRNSAAEGAVYQEYMISPDHFLDNQMDYNEVVQALSNAFDTARNESGVIAKLIMTCVRHRGPRAAIATAELVATNPHQTVVGFGLTGNERRYEADAFTGAFALAGQAGLRLTAHCGEWRDARSVIETVNALGLHRIGHGIRAADDVGILDELAQRKIGFEVCLSSNDRLGAVPSLSHHPIAQMIRRGCCVTLATDDPAFFGTSIRSEYLIAVRHCGLTADELRQVNANALDVAFCSETEKSNLRGRV